LLLAALRQSRLAYLPIPSSLSLLRLAIHLYADFSSRPPAQATGGYGAVFCVAAVLYGTSWLCFLRLLHGEPVSLAGLKRQRAAAA
jgi:hypothetical protein